MLNICISIFFLVLAFLLPYHRTPWPTFGSEILTFLAASFLLLGLLREKVHIPKPQIIVLPIITIPIIQYFCGQILYLSNALFSTAYILMFFCMIIAGYHLSKSEAQREYTFKISCLTFMSIGLISSIFAILQWLDLNTYLEGIVYPLKGTRPYANLAQPNNLATLLILGLLSCLYFFEKRIISNRYLIPISLIILFGIVLAQSRTSIIVCGFIALYWFIKQFKNIKRLNPIYLAIWVGLFILMSSNLASINQYLFSSVDVETTVRGSAIAAKGTGDIRIEMWRQMWVAVTQQPWLGYGWNQTGLAQYYVMDLYQVPLWFKSAHNMVLDLFIWNGVIIGLAIILFMALWMYWLNRGAKDTVSMVAILMVCTILIHGMLEFPLHYAYFLLPTGFLLGLIQGRYRHLPSINFNSKVIVLVAVITILGSVISVRDYFLYKEQSVIALKEVPLNEVEQDVLNQDIFLLTQFKERIWWLRLDPKTKLDAKELAHLEKMVANLAASYDLFKYAQVLAYNGKKQQAEKQLGYLELLHKEGMSYEDLLKTIQ